MTKVKMSAVLIGLLMMFASGTGWSTADSTNDSDSLTIRITPNVDKGVQIDTGTYDSGGYISLGTVDLYKSTFTVRPATVTILGNLGSSGLNSGQELDVSGTITGGWTFDTTPDVAEDTGGELDALAVYLLFSDTTLGAAPSAVEFDSGSGAFNGTSTRAGGSSGNGAIFEHAGTGSTDMDDLSAGDTMHLWLYFRLPSQTSTGSAQDVMITLSVADAS